MLRAEMLIHVTLECWEDQAGDEAIFTQDCTYRIKSLRTVIKSVYMYACVGAPGNSSIVGIVLTLCVGRSEDLGCCLSFKLWWLLLLSDMGLSTASYSIQ
jgi:hypothetical protein